MDYISLQNAIAFELRGVALASSTGFVDRIKTAIQAAIEHYQSNLFWFNAQLSTTPTVAGQEFYALPNDYLASTGSPWIGDTSSRWVLDKKPAGWIGANNRPGNLGTPKHYTFFDNKIRLSPIPSSMYTIFLLYVKSLPELSLDTDSNAWTNEAEALVRRKAEQFLALAPLRDYELYGLMESEIEKELKNLNTKTLDYLQLNRIMPDDAEIRGLHS